MLIGRPAFINEAPPGARRLCHLLPELPPSEDCRILAQPRKDLAWESPSSTSCAGSWLTHV